MRTALLLIFSLTCLGPKCARAAAWTPERGGGILIFSFLDYSARDEFLAGGKRESLPFSGRFRKSEAQAYFEAGIGKRFALIGKLAAPAMKIETNGVERSSFSSGDAELGLRVRLSGAGAQVWSVQALALAPTYRSSTDPSPGVGHGGTEFRLLTGRGYGREHFTAYWSAEGGYRHYAGKPAGSVRFDASFGISPARFRRLTLAADWATIKSTVAVAASHDDFDFASRSAFDLHKAGVSTIWRVAEGHRIQVGWIFDVVGKNVAAGQAFQIAYWRSF